MFINFTIPSRVQAGLSLIHGFDVTSYIEERTLHKY